MQASTLPAILAPFGVLATVPSGMYSTQNQSRLWRLNPVFSQSDGLDSDAQDWTR